MTKKLSEFENQYLFFQEFLGKPDLCNMDPFEIFQIYRDMLINVFTSNLEKLSKVGSSPEFLNQIYDLQLVDQAYLDNFYLCLNIKLNAPDIYNEMLPIIDRNIKANNKTPALQYIDKALAGIMVASLSDQGYSTTRQSAHIAEYLFEISPKVAERQSMIVKEKSSLDFSKPLSIELMALVFWRMKDKKIENITPISKDNIQSQNALQKSINGFKNWQDFSFKESLKYLFNEDGELINTFQKFERDELDYIKSLLKKENYEREDALWILGLSSALKFMPNLFDNPDIFV